MTANTYDNIDDQLVKVMLGEASEAELAEVQQWIKLSSDNQRYFDDFKRIWEESKLLAVQSSVSEEDAWGRFKQRVGSGNNDLRNGAQGGGDSRQEAPVIEMVPRSSSSFKWLRVAAILIVLLTGGWLIYNFSHRPAEFLSFRSGSQVLTDTLPEGSVVTLNKQSSIRYLRSFAGDSRKVEMNGEAFFNVATDKNKPFIVHASGASIKVLGTSFNVKTVPDGLEVIVETGAVEVSLNGQAVRVGAHEKVMVGKNISAPVKEQNKDDLYNYYRTNEFECDGTPLWRLVEKLNEVYGARIVIGDDQKRNLLLTATFHDQSLEEILNIISRTFSITVTKKGEEIILN